MNYRGKLKEEGINLHAKSKRMREQQFVCGTAKVDQGRRLSEDEQLEQNINFAKRFFKERDNDTRRRMR